MNLTDVLIESGKQQKFPKVVIEEKLKHASSNIGVINEIKPNGIGVRFPDMNWNAWFWFENQNDKRTKHTGQLKFVR